MRVPTGPCECFAAFALAVGSPARPTRLVSWRCCSCGRRSREADAGGWKRKGFIGEISKYPGECARNLRGSRE